MAESYSERSTAVHDRQNSSKEALQRRLIIQEDRAVDLSAELGAVRRFSLWNLVACRCSKWTTVDREMERYHASGSLLLLHAVYRDKWGYHKGGSS